MELHLANDAEKVSRDHVTFPAWGTRLTLEQYLERERVLRAHPFSRGMRTWFLVEGSEVLASCETFDNASRVGAVRGNSWSIASVYTEERHRGRGHATKLMDLVAAKHAERSDAQACVLYSDVGERIYARSGYVAVPGDDWTWPPLPGGGEGGGEGPSVPEQAEPPEGVLQLEPTAEQIDWAHERQRLYAKFLQRTPPSIQGAHAGSASAHWAAYFKSNELILLWLQPGTAEETSRVLDVARGEAARCGLERVRAWALPGVPPPLGATVQKRKEELAMFRPAAGREIGSWRLVQRALWV